MIHDLEVQAVAALPGVREDGFRVACTCGWRGPVRQSTEDVVADGDAHLTGG